MRGGRGAVTLGKRGHAARALQAGLEGPLVRRLQGVVESVGLPWKVVPQTPVGPEREENRDGGRHREREEETNGKKDG